MNKINKIIFFVMIFLIGISVANSIPQFLLFQGNVKVDNRPIDGLVNFSIQGIDFIDDISEGEYGPLIIQGDMEEGALFDILINPFGEYDQAWYEAEQEIYYNYPQDIFLNLTTFTEKALKIINSNPEEDEIVVTEAGNINFNISAESGYEDSGKEEDVIRYEWYKDNDGVSNGNSYSYYVNNNAQGIYKIKVEVFDDYITKEREWNIIIGKPIINNFDGDTTDFSNISLDELDNVENVVFEKTSNGKIEFLENLNLIGLYDIENNIKIENGIVAINTNNYTQLNKKARITLRNLNYNTIPKIYYNTGFTTNANEINKECDFCKLISYDKFPTNNGEVIFDVAHFSSFKIGESGEKYDLELFKDLDKCKNDVKGNLNVEIRDPDNNDDFNFGEDIDIKVNVENKNLENKDVIAEAFLYNIDGDDEEENVESESIDIDKNDKEDFELQMKMPENYDNKDNYVLFVKAYEEDNENEQCNYDIIDLDLERESHDVIVKEIELVPKEINCGGSVQAIVVVENIGTKDEEDVYIKLQNSELNISLESDKFSLDDYKGNDEKATKRFSLIIPDNVEAKDYDLEAVVYFDNKNNIKSKTLKIGSCENIKDEDFLLINGETSVNKNIANVHLIVTNKRDENIVASVKMMPIDDLIKEILPIEISLHPGENSIYLNTNIKEGIKGKYSSLVEIKPLDGEAKKINLVFELKEEEMGEEKIEEKREDVLRDFLKTQKGIYFFVKEIRLPEIEIPSYLHIILFGIIVFLTLVFLYYQI